MGFGHTKLRSKSNADAHKAQGKGDAQLGGTRKMYQTDANKVRASGQLGGPADRFHTARPERGKGIFGK